MNMECSGIQLNDLPDEILITIFKKLANIEVLYSLVGVNKRLNKIAHDFVFTNYLTLFMSTSNGFIYSLDDSMIDRFCLYVLPEIHQKIQCLDLEARSMKRILLAANYPILYGLGLFNISVKKLMCLFNAFRCLDKNLLTRTMKNQILSLNIDIDTNKQSIAEDGNANIFTHIFNTFNNLRCLYFGLSSFCRQRLSFDTVPLHVISTNLLKLYVSLHTLNDCLYLLDGRFNQLHTLDANIYSIRSSHLTNNNEEKLPNLKCFSLYSAFETSVYDESILPLLHRMSNLEKLDLCLVVHNRKTFFDGNDFKINIINHLPRLNKFVFNIRSSTYFSGETNLPSNEDIQNIFIDFKDQQIIYCADYFSKEKRAQCHIYSYPYKLKHYHDITNNFPGGIHKCVRYVSLFDERPFEHEFFLRISQSFPLMEELIVNNQKRQINKSKNANQNLPIIKYPHLKKLNLFTTCIDYHEQFLVDSKTCLPLYVNAYMNYKMVRKVTRNFRRKTTRTNCAKLNYVCLHRKSEFVGYMANLSLKFVPLPEHVKDYFPRALIE